MAYRADNGALGMRSATVVPTIRPFNASFPQSFAIPMGEEPILPNVQTYLLANESETTEPTASRI